MQLPRLPGVDPRAEMWRRCVLGLVTALIVARPLVLGEDPGITSTLTNPSGLFLNVLWFVAAVGWGVWRAWSGEATWRRSAVEAALAAVVVLVFVSVPGTDRYKHPATLIAWEWVVLLLSFCLVRQLARTRDDNQALLAVVVATGLSLAVYAIFQYTVELPRIRDSYLADAEALRQAVGPQMTLDDVNLEHMRRRIQEDNVFATYAHPNSFAGYLALLFPSSIAWAVAGWRRWSWGWQRILTASCALVFALALWLTHSRGAILASLLVAVAVLVLRGRGLWWRRKGWVLAGVVGLAGAVVVAGQTEWGAAGLGKAGRSFGLRTGYWNAAWSMIREHLWRGVGPGNFGLRYPRYMSPAAYEKVQDPHNFVLEIWATSGVFALLALLVALALLFHRLWPVIRGPLASLPREPQTEPASGTGIRWEFYVGGMTGIVIGFVLRALDQPGNDILYEGTLSACRCLVWFAAFVLLNSICLGGPARCLAITAGVTALLLNLLVSGGIALPSVAQPLWIMAALAMNALEERAPVLPQAKLWFESVLPLPVLAGTALAYLVLVFYPVVGSSAVLLEARGHAAEWQRTVRPELIQTPAEGKSQKQNQALLARTAEYLKDHILKPLEDSIRQDPGNVQPRLELADWYIELARLVPDKPQFVKLAGDQLSAVQNLNPNGKEGYLAAYRLHVAALGAKSHDKSHATSAALALERAVERDPTEARLRYQSAEAWYQADDAVRGRRQAAVARDLDELATVPERHLTDEQRRQVEAWLEKG
jgi:hypothetical protein